MHAVYIDLYSPTISPLQLSSGRSRSCDHFWGSTVIGLAISEHKVPFGYIFCIKNCKVSVQRMERRTEYEERRSNLTIREAEGFKYLVPT
jgi:hypothetical protein